MNYEDYARNAMKAMDAHRARMKADGLLSEEREYPCLLNPADGVRITRMGKVGGEATYIRLDAAQGMTTATVALSLPEARRLVAGLLDLIEEADPAKPVMRVEPPTAEEWSK